jgi:hypothetical protein
MTFPDIEIFIYEYLDKIGEKYIFEGLGFDAYVTASNLETAQQLMRNTIFRILDIFTYVSLSPWTNLSLIFSYEANEELILRKCFYYFYYLKKIEVVKSIRPSAIDIFFEVCKKLDTNIFRDNILASLHQLNKGLQSDTNVDEFLSYWMAIEYLSQSLNEKYGYGKVERFHECPYCNGHLSECQHCHKELPKKIISPGKFKRVEEIALEKLSITKKIFKEIVNTRAIIIHGGKWDGLGDAYKYKDLIRNLLMYCIGELLDLNHEVIEKILEKQTIIRNKITTDIGFVCKADITGLDKLPSLDKPDEQPLITVKNNTELGIKINDDGSVGVSNTPYLISAGKEILFKNIAYAIYSHRLSGVKNANISERIIKKRGDKSNGKL